MLVYSKVNVIIPSNDGRQHIRLNRGDVAEVPKWAAATKYFKLLQADGQLVTTSKAAADKDAQQAEDKKPGQEPPKEDKKPSQAGEPAGDKNEAEDAAK